MGSSNGLLSDSINLPPEPVLTYHQTVLKHLWVTQELLIMAADALAPYVARTSAAMILTM